MTDDEKIAAFIAANGVTRCEPAEAEGLGADIWPMAPTADGEPPTPESALAVRKLIVMLQDLAGKAHGEHRGGRKAMALQARHWFFSPGTDFEQWCEMAGLDPDYVRRKARQLLDRGLPPGTKAGEGGRYEYKKAWRKRRGDQTT